MLRYGCLNAWYNFILKLAFACAFVYVNIDFSKQKVIFLYRRNCTFFTEKNKLFYVLFRTREILYLIFLVLGWIIMAWNSKKQTDIGIYNVIIEHYILGYNMWLCFCSLSLYLHCTVLSTTYESIILPSLNYININN